MANYKYLNAVFLRNSLCGGVLALAACGTVTQTPIAVEKEGFFQIKQMKRRVRDSKAILLGSLNDNPSKKHFAQLAMVVLNNQTIVADSTGHYQQEVEKGTYTVIGRNIFYNNLTIKHVRIQQGDSLKIDFYLSPSQTVN